MKEVGPLKSCYSHFGSTLGSRKTDPFSPKVFCLEVHWPQMRIRVVFVCLG